MNVGDMSHLDRDIQSPMNGLSAVRLTRDTGGLEDSFLELDGLDDPSSDNRDRESDRTSRPVAMSGIGASIRSNRARPI